MGKKSIKVAATAMSAVTLASMLAACGGGDSSSTTGSSSSGGSQAATTTSNASTPSEGVATLSWYYPDDMNDHTAKVWSAINEYTTEKIGAVVEYHPIPWGEYDSKATTVMTSGQNFDIMFSNASYFKNVNAGAAQPIEQYLQTVGKEMYETLPDSLWTAATVNDHIYGVPTYKDNAACPGLIYNKDMAEDLGITMPTSFDAFSDLSDLFYEIKEKRDAKYPEDKNIPIFKGFNLVNSAFEMICDNYAVTPIPGIDVFEGKKPGDVFNVYTTDTQLEAYKLVRKWVEDGIYPMDAANYDTENSIRNSGKIFCDSPLGYVSFPENGWSEDVRTGFIPSTWRYMTTDYAMFGSNIVGAKSANPEKAVAFLNLVNSDNYVANTLRFGIEGEYYNKTDKGTLDFTGTLNSDPANRSYYKWYGWQFGNIFAMSLPDQEDPNLWTNLKKANEEALVSDNMGFVFDRTGVENQIASCTSVKTEYEDNLKNGMLPDVDKSFADFNAKLTASGVDKIVEEAQKQLSEWRAANGK